MFFGNSKEYGDGVFLSVPVCAKRASRMRWRERFLPRRCLNKQSGGGTRAFNGWYFERETAACLGYLHPRWNGFGAKSQAQEADICLLAEKMALLCMGGALPGRAIPKVHKSFGMAHSWEYLSNIKDEEHAEKNICRCRSFENRA